MKIIVITGQTATGKTDLALQKAQEYNGEIINCDSRQIYKNLDIITGKDLPDQTFHKFETINGFDVGYYLYSQHTKLWLYDIVYPHQHFSSHDYTLCAEIVIKKLLKEHKTPIIVGGTYLYLQHLLYGFDTQVEPNWPLRKDLDTKTVSELQEILKKINNETFMGMNTSDQANPRRLMRKIEIAQSSISPKIQPNSLSDRLDQKVDIEIIGLKHPSTDDLKQTITTRVENRIKNGAYEEVQKLIQIYKKTDPGLKTIGYQQIIDVLENRVDESKLNELWITKELQYAKRQYTFMKKDPNITWII